MNGEFPYRDQVDQYEKQELDQEYRDRMTTPTLMDEDELIELERELDCE